MGDCNREAIDFAHIRRCWGACWMPKAERNKTLWGGGRGGIPASFCSRSPPPKQPFQPTQEHLRFGWFLWGTLVGWAPSPGGPGPKPPGDLAPGAWIPPLSLVDFLQVFNFCSAHFGGRWMVSDGRTLQSHERRASRLRSSISAAGPGPKFLGTWPTSP